MMVRKMAGVLLLISGLYVAITNFINWQESRSSASTLTGQELQKYESLTVQTSTGQTTVSPEYEHGEKIATLIIPDIQQKFTVYWGTEEDVLEKGVGMFDSTLTTFPGHGHTVLSGHRDTVFSGLEKLDAGDRLIVEFEEQTFTYIIEKTWITDKDDRSVIVKKNEPVLTLTTCYPFTYVGDAPDRYIIQGKLL
ncbi:MAG: class D sortase [Bacillus sp. (in: firmicutes)]